MHRERVSENVFWFQSEVYAQVTAGVVAGPQWAVVIDTLALPDETLSIREFIEHEQQRMSISRHGSAVVEVHGLRETADDLVQQQAKERSRPMDDIVAECRALADRGVREITLLGQNVNAWHGTGPDGRDWGLGDLLRRLGEIEGLARLRYTTSHPRDMDDSLIEAHRSMAKLMPYLHLPVQSGSDRILKAMNRRHTAAEYLALVERIRAAQPDLALSGDFIVGFPGETEEDFEDTMRLVEAVNYAQAFSFKYSSRPGTPGAESEEWCERRLLARIHRDVGNRDSAACVREDAHDIGADAGSPASHDEIVLLRRHRPEPTPTCTSV